jgi:polar amino acid transport system substrate-binding protein
MSFTSGMAGSADVTLSRMLRPAALAAIVILAGSCSRSHSGTWKAVQDRGELRWGGDYGGGEPYIYLDADQKLVGFEVDIMDELTRRLGVKPTFVQHDWANLVPSLQRGDFDVVMNGLEDTDDRRQQLRLSHPYFIYAETLTVRKGSPIRSMKDLDGKTVGTLNQTYAYDVLRDAKGVTIKPYEGNIEPYDDLENGRIDAVLLDNIIADRYGCNRDTLECLPDEVARGTYVIGIRKEDPELEAAIDGALDAMKSDGTLEKILRHAGLWDARQTEPPPETVTPSTHPSQLAELGLFLRAALVTLEVSLLSFLLAVPIGLVLAVSRVYGRAPMQALARVYIELFRGTPVLLQLYVLYYGLADVWNLSAIQAAVIGLGLNYGAYEAEVYRGALLAIPRGQTEASKALGLGPWQTLRHILLPQALRLALPPMTNDFVSLLKDSSLVGVIAVIELTKRMQLAGEEMHSWLLPGVACAAFYLALSFPLAEIARRLERKLSRDQRPAAL